MKILQINLLVLVISLVLISGCTQQAPVEEKKAERNFLDENTQLYTALKLLGLEALVDSTSEKVLIRLELPSEYSKELSVVAALSAAAVVQSDQIVVQIYKDEKKTDEIKTTKQAALDLINGKTSAEEFLDNLDWQTF